MNIAIVCYPTFGGSGVLATELGKALADKGHQIHFITYQQPVRLSHFHGNIFYHVVRVPTYPLFDYPPYETALSSMMVDVIHREEKLPMNPHGGHVNGEGFVSEMEDGSQVKLVPSSFTIRNNENKERFKKGAAQ